jgi:hypothetical protein
MLVIMEGWRREGCEEVRGDSEVELSVLGFRRAASR